MQRVELLCVEERFQIDDRGLSLVPDFAPPAGSWSDRDEFVLVVTPDGTEVECRARFGLAHFNFKDPAVLLEKRWRIVVNLLGLSKVQVPIGSRVFVPPEVRDAVLGKAQA